MMQVEVVTVENTTGLPLIIFPGELGDSKSDTETLPGQGSGQRSRPAGPTRRLSDSLAPYNWNSDLHGHGLALLDGSSSGGSIISISGGEEDEEKYDYGDISGVMYSRDPKRWPKFVTTRPSLTNRSSILSLPRGRALLPRPSLKEQNMPSTTTRGPPLELPDEVISSPPPIKRTSDRSKSRPKRLIRHLEADATAMLSTIGEIEGMIFKENLMILEEDGLEEPIDMATICCKTWKRRKS